MRSIQTFSWKKQYLAEKDLISFNHEALNRNFSKELEQLGITMSEIDYQCDQIFRDTPIRFYPRKGFEIDEKIDLILQTLGITIPVKWIVAD